MFFASESLKHFLQESLVQESNLPLSLLFWGEEGIGKMTAAKYLAATILCQTDKKKWGGCARCRSCQMVKNNIHPDLKIILGLNESIKIEDINGEEGIINFLSFYPQLSPARIVIMDNADRMTLEAQNAFLKTLEEPPSKSLIILISAQPLKLLPTVRSRLISLRFQRASGNKIAKFLEKEKKIPQEQATSLANLSQGRIGLALRLLDENYLNLRQEAVKDLQNLLTDDLLAKFNYLEQNTADRELLKEKIVIWLEFLNQQLLLEEAARSVSYNKIENLTKELLVAYDLLNNTNINQRLLIENIFLTV